MSRTLLLWLNLFGAIGGVVGHVIGFIWSDRRNRPLYAVIITVAALYLLVIPGRMGVFGQTAQQWTDIGLGVGLFAWPFVWIAPPIIAAIRFQKIKRDVVGIVLESRSTLQ